MPRAILTCLTIKQPRHLPGQNQKRRHIRHPTRRLRSIHHLQRNHTKQRLIRSRSRSPRRSQGATDDRPAPLLDIAFDTARTITDMLHRGVFRRHPNIEMGL